MPVTTGKPPRTGRPARLSIDHVLAAAERLASERGVDALTMRSLASALQVSPMALYRYVPDKRSLLVALLDRQVAQLPRPRLPREPRRRVAALFRWLYAGLAERPWVVSLLTRGDLMAPSVTWAMEEILASFTMLGLSPRRAVDAYLTTWRYTVGTLVIQHATAVSDPSGDRVQDTALVAAESAPLLAATAPYWPQARAHFDYARGLDAVLDGLVDAARLTTSDRPANVSVRVHKVDRARRRSMNGTLGYWSLNVADTDRAQRFFGAVFGWTFTPPGTKGGVHVEDSAGGLHPQTLDVSPVALLVDDLDKAVERVRELGGSSEDPTGELPVRYAEAVDPAGARFGLVEFGPTHLPPTPPPTGDGQLGYWNLVTPDQERSRAFFAELFGWTYGAPGSAGGLPIEGSAPLGFLSPGHAEDGGLAFFVDDASVTVSAIRSAGGTADDPVDSPYGPYAAATDDQGAHFAVWQPAR